MRLRKRVDLAGTSGEFKALRLGMEEQREKGKKKG
jgi:hypothetical protein